MKVVQSVEERQPVTEPEAVAHETTAPDVPRRTGVFEIEIGPVPVSVVVATPPRVVRPDVWVK